MDQKFFTFLTLCRTMNYRRASAELHLTQPAVTKQIQSLEAQYGVKLFSYDERKLRKTAQGEILERYAMELQYNDAELARLLAAKPKTLLRIGATKSIGDYILIPEIRRFLARPENELFFTVDNTAHLLSQQDPDHDGSADHRGHRADAQLHRRENGPGDQVAPQAEDCPAQKADRDYDQRLRGL